MAKKAEKKIENDVVTITAIESGESVTVDLNELSNEMQLKLALHGLSQKVGDSYAGCEVDEIIAKATGVINDLKNGDWSSRVAGSGAPRTTLLAEAVVRATGQTMEVVLGKIAEMDDDAKKNLRNHDQIKQATAAIKAERAVAAAEKAAAAGSEDVALEF